MVLQIDESGRALPGHVGRQGWRVCDGPDGQERRSGKRQERVCGSEIGKLLTFVPALAPPTPAALRWQALLGCFLPDPSRLGTQMVPDVDDDGVKELSTPGRVLNSLDTTRLNAEMETRLGWIGERGR